MEITEIVPLMNTAGIGYFAYLLISKVHPALDNLTLAITSLTTLVSERLKK